MTKYGPKHNLDAAPPPPRARLPSHGPRKRPAPSMPRLNLPPPVDEDD